MIDADLIRELEQPSCYRHSPKDVAVVQTHLSVVCLAGDLAYKIKKPVRLPFVDFSTLERRKHFCEEEVRLNRRLCEGLYLGVVPLVRGDGGLRFGDGDVHGRTVIDYAVHMRRLPASRMMDVVLAEGQVGETEVGAIALQIGEFHLANRVPPDCEDARASADRVRAFALGNFEETESLAGEIFDPLLHRELRRSCERDFAERMPQLRDRARRGLVVDGHGDLHARNICLLDAPAIYDCLEFSRELRISDPAAENAFLVMDLRYRGYPELAAAYLARYVARTADEDQLALIPMMVQYRAMVRAKVAAIAAGEEEIDLGEREECAEAAMRHANLAAIAALERGTPLLLCACGLPASGKSSAFEALARASGWHLFSSDVIRKELAGVGASDPAPRAHYTPENRGRVYRAMMERADGGLHAGPVLLDANFGSAATRAAAIELARRQGARIGFIWFRADDLETGRRMGLREGEGGGASDADYGVFQQLKRSFEVPQREEGAEVVAIENGGDDPRQLGHALGELLSRFDAGR